MCIRDSYNAERRRLKALGKNPDSVHWVSNTDELSPYDLMSVDGDNQVIYVEVKSTRDSDPTAPFYISHAELIEAMYRRSRYYVYRVTDVDSATPAITRWADPLALIKEGKGQLLLCLLYTSDAADERSSVDLGGRRTIKKKKKKTTELCQLTQTQI